MKESKLTGFRDPIWQFWGVLIAAISLLITLAVILYNFLFPSTKSLDVIVLASTPLIEISDSAGGQIEVLYNGQRVEYPFLLQVQLENSGTQTIRPLDYDRPISFVFHPDASVLDVSVADSNPANIGISARFVDNTVVLSKSLLNSEDRVIIRILVDSIKPVNDQLFSVDGRIAGIKQIAVTSALERKPSQTWLISLGPVAVLLSILLLIGFIVWLILHLFSSERIRRRGAVYDIFDNSE